MSSSSNNNQKIDEKPGDGIRSMRSSTAFRVINFELYAKPVRNFTFYISTASYLIWLHIYIISFFFQNIVIMSIGLTCFGLALGYITYMRQKYESMGYYSAINEEGKETFEKRKSKWD